MLSALLLLRYAILDVHVGVDVDESLCGIEEAVGSGDMEGRRPDDVVGVEVGGGGRGRENVDRFRGAVAWVVLRGVDGAVQGSLLAESRGAVDLVAVAGDEVAESWEVEVAGGVVEGGVVVFELFFILLFDNLDSRLPGR